MYGDQFGEFLCGYRGLKGQDLLYLNSVIFIVNSLLLTHGLHIPFFAPSNFGQCLLQCA